MTPQRIQLSRAKGWRMPPESRVVTRSTIFGNPWACDTSNAFWWPNDPKGLRWVSTHRIPHGVLSAQEAVAQFKAWMDGYAIPFGNRPVGLTREGQRACWDALAARRSTVFGALPALRGKNLACWCRPGTPCHADVLLELANAEGGAG